MYNTSAVSENAVHNYRIVSRDLFLNCLQSPKFTSSAFATNRHLPVCWSIRQDSTSSDGNASRSQNECIGIISGSLYTQANERGIEECMGENHEGEKGELMPR
jgi:hypothetical protein